MKATRHSAFGGSASTGRSGRLGRTAKAVLALATALGALAPAAQSGAAEPPANHVRNGPNLTLVVAHCPGPADNAAAAALAHRARNAAKVCIAASRLSPELLAVVAEFAPDRILVVGGEAAVTPAMMAELTAAARSVYRWTVVERIGGPTRVHTAAAAARAALEPPAVLGPRTATLIVADGWNGADVRTAAEVAEHTPDAAVAYVSPRTIADGLPDATASLIADYQPARVVIVGLSNEVGSATETAIAATLKAIGSSVDIERVVEAGEPYATIPETSPGIDTARAIFTAIQQGVPRPSARSETSLPILAASSARGPAGEGRGEQLWTIRADGSQRRLRSPDHRGWAWQPGGGELSWSSTDGQLRLGEGAGDGAGDERIILDPGGYPAWSPDGSHVVAFGFLDTDGDGRRDLIEAHIGGADGTGLRRIGHVNYRTYLFSDLPLANWSPDGQRFAYVESTTDPETGDDALHARIWNVEQGAPGLTLGEDITFLGWSPDGTHLAYATPSDCNRDGHDEQQNLWIARSDGSNARDLGFIDRIQWRYLQLWSPDGTHLAYESRDPADCSMLLKVETVNGDATALTPVAGGRLIGWSPSGTHLGYGVTVGTPGRGIPLREHAWVVRRDGSDMRELGEIRDNVFGALLWTPDGDYFAYTEVVRGSDGEVTGTRPIVERSSGVGGATLLSDRGNALGWSPVSRRLAYVSHYDEDSDGEVDRRALRVHTVGSSDADVTLVHELPDLTLGALWSPDGDYIGYGSGPAELLLDWFINRRRGSDAWVVATEEPRWTRRLVTDVAWGAWQPE